MSFAIQVFACSFCSSIGVSHNNFVVELASDLFPIMQPWQNANSQSCIPSGINLKCLRRFTSFRIKHSIPGSGRLQTKFEPARFPFVRQVDYTLNSDPLSCFRCPFWWFKTLNGTFPLSCQVTPIIKPDLALVPTREVLECSTVFVKQIQIITSYDGFLEISLPKVLVQNCIYLIKVKDSSISHCSIEILHYFQRFWGFVLLNTWNLASYSLANYVHGNILLHIFGTLFGFSFFSLDVRRSV